MQWDEYVYDGASLISEELWLILEKLLNVSIKKIVRQSFSNMMLLLALLGE